MASISGVLDRILGTISRNEVTMVTTQTSSGKTTLIPAALARTGLGNVKVIVSVPTKIAAETHYNFVKNNNKDIYVDYAVRGVYVKELPDVLYATTGTIINYIYNKLSGGRYVGSTHKLYLVMDEVHTKSPENNILLSLWLHIRNNKVPSAQSPKLILMSAAKTIVKLDDINIANEEYVSKTRVTTIWPEKKNNVVQPIKANINTRKGGKYSKNNDINNTHIIY